MSDELDRVNQKIDKLIKRVDMELKSEGFDSKSVANIMSDFLVLFEEKIKALQIQEDEKERGF